MMAEIEAKKKLEEMGGDQPLHEDALHACALLSARRYTAGEGAEAVRALLTRFRAGGQASSPLTPGEAAKTAVFKSVAVCIKQLGEEGLLKFKEAGGFKASSTEKLADVMAEEAEGKKAT